MSVASARGKKKEKKACNGLVSVCNVDAIALGVYQWVETLIAMGCASVEGVEGVGTGRRGQL